MPKPAQKPVSRSKLVLPTSKSKLPLRVADHVMMFYGPPGVGKTTFVNNLGERVLFISTDRGTAYIESLRVPVTTFEEVMEAIVSVRVSNNANRYDMICIDHVDDVARWIDDHVCETLEVDSLADAEWGKGWSAYAKRMASLISELKRTRLGLAFTAHETVKTIRANGIEREVIMPELNKRTAKFILPLCDVVGYCGFKRIKNPNGAGMIDQRILITQPDASVYAKDRTDRKKPTGHEILDGRKFIGTFQTR